MLLGFIEHRVVTSNGIEIFGLHYNCQELSLIRRFSGTGQRELIKYDPDDISQIYCYNRRDDEFIRVPALDQEYTRGLTLWQHEAFKKYNRNVLKNELNSEGLRRTRETVQSIILEDMAALKTIAQRQKFMRLLNIGQPDYTPEDNLQINDNSIEIEQPMPDTFTYNDSFSGVSNIGSVFDEYAGDEITPSSSPSGVEFVSLAPKKKRRSSKQIPKPRNTKTNDFEPVYQDKDIDSVDDFEEDREFTENEEWSVSYDLPVD